MSHERAFSIFALIPNSEWKTVFLQEVAATRTAARIFPGLHGMFWVHRTGQRQVAPDQLRRRFRGGIHGAFAEDGRRDFRPVKSGESHQVNRIHPPALAREDIIQLPAIVANHGLNLTMPAAVRAAGNFHAVLAQRTFEEIRFAHRWGGIQRWAGEFKPVWRVFAVGIVWRSWRLADSPGHHGLANGTLKILYDFSCYFTANCDAGIV